jgi:uncharacterized protein (TIRG00374 family)
MKGLRQTLSFLVKLGITLFFLWLTTHSLREEWEGGVSLRGWVAGMDFRLFAAALAATAASMVLGAWQWHQLLQHQGVDYRFRRTLAVYFQGLFFNNFLLGNAGGDLKRIYDVKRDSQHLSGGFTATVFDRLLGLFVLIAIGLAAGGLWFVDDPKLGRFVLPQLWVLLGMGGFLAALFSRRLSGLLDRRLRRVGLGKLADGLAIIVSRFQRYREGGLWARLFTISAAVQLLRISTHLLCGLAIGLAAHPSHYLYFIPLTGIISALPISVGGFGPREWLVAVLFVPAGYPASGAVVMVLLAHLTAVITSLPGGVLFVLGRRSERQREVANPT